MLKKILNFKDYLSLTVKLILILSIINAIAYHLWHILSASIFLLLLSFFPQIIRTQKINLPKEFEVLLLIFVLTTFLIGRINYAIAPILFGVSVGFIGFFISFILYSTNQIKKNYFLIISFSFCLAVAFGATLEIIKFYLKFMLGHSLSPEIYEFSIMTLTYVLIGATMSSLIGYLYMKNRIKFIHKLAKKFLKKNPELFSSETELEEIKELIKQGESERLEFKSTLRKNLHTNEKDKKIENSALKTLVGFMNSLGGTLLIGVNNSGEITGIEKDDFPDIDKFSLHFTNIVKQRIGKEYLPLINTEIIKINKKNIFRIDCKKSEKPVFLKLPEKEEFYIRAGPSSNEISGSELLEYIEKRFKKN